MITHVHGVRVTCDDCKKEQVYVRDYGWQAHIPEGWVSIEVKTKSLFGTIKYFEYCPGCAKKEHQHDY